MFLKLFQGDYAGFDENEPTSQQEGKAEVVAYLKHRCGYRRLIMIGDGATDLAACPPAVSVLRICKKPAICYGFILPDLYIIKFRSMVIKIT